jgi:hypothetical protein
MCVCTCVSVCSCVSKAAWQLMALTLPNCHHRNYSAAKIKENVEAEIMQVHIIQNNRIKNAFEVSLRRPIRLSALTLLKLFNPTDPMDTS